MRSCILSVLACFLLLSGISGCKTVGAIKEDVNSLVGKSSNEPTESFVVPSDERQLVQEVQTMLAEKSYDPGPIDGIPGPSTNTALREFQESHDLTITNGVTEEAYIQLKSEGASASANKQPSQVGTRECVKNFTKQSGMRKYRTSATLNGVSKELAVQRLVRALGREGFVINENDASKGYVNATYGAGSSNLQLSAFIKSEGGGSNVELNYVGTGASFGLMLTPGSAYRKELCYYIGEMRSGN